MLLEEGGEAGAARLGSVLGWLEKLSSTSYTFELSLRKKHQQGPTSGPQTSSFDTSVAGIFCK